MEDLKSKVEAILQRLDNTNAMLAKNGTSSVEVAGVTASPNGGWPPPVRTRNVVRYVGWS